MILVVFPVASPWLKTWTNSVGAPVDKMFSGKLIIDTKLNNPRAKKETWWSFKKYPYGMIPDSGLDGHTPKILIFNSQM